MLHQKKSSIFKSGVKVSCAFLLCAGIFVFSCSPALEEEKSFVVLIDPGHGGIDSGSETSGGLNEKNINLEIANQLLASSKNSDVKIILIRSSDEFISLNDRAKVTNEIKPDLLLSLHCNSSKNKDLIGVEGYYSSNNVFDKISKSYAEILIQKQGENKEIKGNSKSADYKLLRDSKVPSVLLELGFLSNTEDSKRLHDAKQQKIIASSILDGLEQIRVVSK